MNLPAARRAGAALVLAALALTGCGSSDGTSNPSPKPPGQPPALPSGLPSGLPSAPVAPSATGH